MPYVMMHHEKNYIGNSRFYGFCVDLLAAVAREVGFSYRLELVPDRKYGARDPETGEWNGIVNELMRHVRFGLFVLFFFASLCFFHRPISRSARSRIARKSAISLDLRFNRRVGWSSAFYFVP
jgi:hypothetical protein